ncbi:Regulatory protein BlaR1 [Gimesia panareensis]|uniref:Regulatory protein BlaR1 n=1 Tax=Gimesia panareensis TaxID=2527978 RepID=A0A517QDL4_9PLAN|nr:M56 family metallopeptidase [Gimesia panareensis]QDT29694.1 Regulatory protein BlaR1 [Gimesia panareensis]
MNGFEQTLVTLNNTAEPVIETLIAPALTAAFLMLFVLAVNLLLRKWLTAAQMGLLWGLVLLRLAMPFGPESSFSLQNLIFVIEQNTIEAERPVDPWRPADQVSQWATPDSAPQAVALLATNPAPEPENGFTTALFQKLIYLLDFLLSWSPFIWLAGAIGLLSRTIIGHWRFTRIVSRGTAASDGRLIQLWADCCREVSFRRTIPIVILDELAQPAVCGLFRPKLLLPADVADLDDRQLRLIMLHELTHLIRRDLWVNWILFGLKLLYWWNPTYWLAATRYFSLREQSRDAMVLHWLEQHHVNQQEFDYPRDYSELLLTLAQRPDTGARWRISLPVSMLGFLKNPLRKRSLANRLKALRTATVKVHPLHRTLVISALMLFTISGLTDARYPQLPEAEVPLWTSAVDVDFMQTDFPDPGPVTVQVYDLKKSIKRFMETEKIPEKQAREWIRLLIQNQFNFLKPSGQSLDSLPAEDVPQAEFGEEQQLVVRAPAAWQKELEIQLKAWEKSGLRQVTFETRTAALSTDISSLADFEWNSLEAFGPETQTHFDQLPESGQNTLQASAVVDEYFPIRVAVLNQGQQRQFLQVAQADSRSSLLFAPKVTLFNGQRVILGNTISRPFLTGLHKQPDGQLKPVVETIGEGLHFTLRPEYAADCSTLHLSGLIQLSRILDVNLYDSEIQGKPVTIQVPRVFRRRISVSSNLQDHQALLICIPPSPHENQFQYLMLKVRFINDADNFGSLQ